MQKILQITDEALLSLLNPPGDRLVIPSGWPEDVKIVGIVRKTWPDKPMIEVGLESEDFPEDKVFGEYFCPFYTTWMPPREYLDGLKPPAA